MTQDIDGVVWFLKDSSWLGGIKPTQDNWDAESQD